MKNNNKNILINLFILYFYYVWFYILLFVNINYYIYKRNKIFNLIILIYNILSNIYNIKKFKNT